MSVAEPAARGQQSRAERSLTGWGHIAPSRAKVIAPRDVQEVSGLLAAAQADGTGVIARGAGRSYGDAAQNGGGTVLEMSGWDTDVSIDGAAGRVIAGAGATVGQLLRALAAEGLTLPVVPGTGHVTVGGAIASDVHGKNHHRDGGLARHVHSLELCTPAEGRVELSASSDPELFYATLGGMGLTGVVVRATLATMPLPSPWLTVDVDRTDGFEQTLELLSASESHRYSVAWLDLLAPGARMGRAVVSRAEHLPAAQAPAPRSAPERGRGTGPGVDVRPVAVPRRFPAALLRPEGLRAFNALRWRCARRRARGRPVALGAYMFPLDRLGEWHRLYGRRGLIQYQFVIPGAEQEGLLRCMELMQSARLPAYLAVFKRLGPAFGGPLSFPLDGWTLAVDMPARLAELGATLDRLDELVAALGGRVYLTKDARLRRDLLEPMYPLLEQFRAVCERADPEGVLRSDLSRRLGLRAVA